MARERVGGDEVGGQWRVSSGGALQAIFRIWDFILRDVDGSQRT